MTLARVFRLLQAALLLLSVSAAPAVAQAGRYDSFYVFGDSLADTGNVWLTTKVLGQEPTIPPEGAYLQGRFTNGPVAFEYLWGGLQGLPFGTPGALVPYIASPILAPRGAVNFAFGGTGTAVVDQTPGGLYAPGLRGQVELFGLSLRGRRPSPSALYAIVTGANDYSATPYNTPMRPRDVVQNVSDAVERLYAFGARDIVLLTLPDIGLTPQALAAGTSAIGLRLTTEHNELLSAAVLKLGRRYRDLTLRLVDTNVVFRALREGIVRESGQPLAWALPALDALVPVPPGTVPTSACLFVQPSTCPDLRGMLPAGALPRPALLFWDVVHPTTDAHLALAAYMYEQLAR